MTTSLNSSSGSAASHRTYADRGGTDPAFCRLITQEDELLRLVVGVGRIELRQSPGAGWIPTSMTEPLVQALRSIDLAGSSDDPRSARIEREMRRRLVDALARIRIRYNRHLFAGVTRIFRGEEDELVLVLVFGRRGVHSCEWKLAA